MFIADLRLISPEFSTWFLKRDWIVILLGRREKFVTTPQTRSVPQAPFRQRQLDVSPEPHSELRLR